MSAKWQRVTIEIPESFGPDERRAIGLEIVDFIVSRTKDGKDKNNRKFAGYSKNYTKSLDFKIAGKSKGSVDLELSGDMLGALDILKEKRGAITIGYENGSPENDRADGNIRGTYGQSSPVTKGRDFLGITKKDLNSILQHYKGNAADKHVEAVLAGDTRTEDDE